MTFKVLKIWLILKEKYTYSQVIIGTLTVYICERFLPLSNALVITLLYIYMSF